MDAAADKDGEVRDSITKSIVDIGRRKHGQVLVILHNYLSKRPKVGVAEDVVAAVAQAVLCSWPELIASSC